MLLPLFYPACPLTLRYLLAKCPLLLEEMLKIAMLPRTQAGTGWMVSGVALAGSTVCLLACLQDGLLAPLFACKMVRLLACSLARLLACREGPLGNLLACKNTVEHKQLPQLLLASQALFVTRWGWCMR